MKKSRMREPKRRQGVMPIRALGLSASLARIEGDTQKEFSSDLGSPIFTNFSYDYYCIRDI